MFNNCALLQAIYPREEKPSPFDARIKKLEAVGYGIIAAITSIAILALGFAVSFVGYGLVAARFYGIGLDAALSFTVHALFFAGIIGSLIAYYPIRGLWSKTTPACNLLKQG